MLYCVLEIEKDPIHPPLWSIDPFNREGHLEEFCFRRKRAVRREQERRNADMYSALVYGPPRRGGRQDVRAHRVGGGQGDGGAYRAPAGGRFAGRAPGHF